LVINMGSEISENLRHLWIRKAFIAFVFCQSVCIRGLTGFLSALGETGKWVTGFCLPSVISVFSVAKISIWLRLCLMFSVVSQLSIFDFLRRIPLWRGSGFSVKSKVEKSRPSRSSCPQAVGVAPEMARKIRQFRPSAFPAVPCGVNRNLSVKAQTCPQCGRRALQSATNAFFQECFMKNKWSSGLSGRANGKKSAISGQNRIRDRMRQVVTSGHKWSPE